MIEVGWSKTEQNVVVWTFASQWTWNELYAAKQTADGMIDNVEGIVDSIFLTSNIQSVPPDAISRFRDIFAHRHERQNLTILVGSQILLTAVMNMVIKSLPHVHAQLYFANTLEEGYRIIVNDRRDRHTYVFGGSDRTRLDSMVNKSPKMGGDNPPTPRIE